MDKTEKMSCSSRLEIVQGTTNPSIWCMDLCKWNQHVEDIT